MRVVRMQPAMSRGKKMRVSIRADEIGLSRILQVLYIVELVGSSGMREQMTAWSMI